MSEVINISGKLTDENDLDAPTDSIHFDDLFVFEGKLNAGTYYLMVKGDGTETGRYTVRAIVDAGQTAFVNRCTNISRSAGINGPLYGCQWHLKNNDQFRNSAGQDIRVEEVWPTRTGSGIYVAVVDDGMHYQHEDLKDNVLTSFNHNYDPDTTDTTDIYHPFEDHGTAVAGLIAAKDNGLGMRGVAPEAKIYGYNYLVLQSDANEANAMSRNATTTAISNNSWGPGDSARPEHTTELWEAAVKDGGEQRLWWKWRFLRLGCRQRGRTRLLHPGRVFQLLRRDCRLRRRPRRHTQRILGKRREPVGVRAVQQREGGPAQNSHH